MNEFNRKDIEASVRSFIAENLLFSNDGYPHPDDTSFLESGVVDSMGIMELVMFIEEKIFLVSEQERFESLMHHWLEMSMNYFLKWQRAMSISAGQ